MHAAQASRRAILNANYMASRLKDDYTVLFTGDNGTCAHEFIIDLRPLKDSAGAPLHTACFACTLSCPANHFATRLKIA